MKRAAAVALLAVLFLFGATLRAEDGKTYAVIVGIGQFEDKNIKPRPSAITDAKAMYDTLTEKTVGGVDPANVQLLLSGKGEIKESKVASKANILAALKDLAAKAGKDDKVIIFMVGQGAPTGDRTCFFAVDSTVKDRAKDAITPAEIRPEMKALKAQKVCVLLDFNLKSFDPGKEPLPQPHITDLVYSFLGMEENDEAKMAAGREVILAGNGTSPTVVTDKNQDIFATAVIAGLRGAADKESNEPDGIITLDELIKYLDTELSSLGRKFGKTKEEKEQGVFYVGMRDPQFFLSHNPEVESKVQERLKKFESIVKDAKLSKEIAEEGKKLLRRSQKLAAMQKLRSNYQDLADGKLTPDQFVKGRDSIYASMKLEETDGSRFAKRTFDALEIYKKYYIKELDETEMIVNAIRGLYRRTDVPMSDELKARLDKAKKLEKPELIALLSDARLPIGRREDLDKDHDVEIAIVEGINKLVDPYTTYVDREQVEALENSVTGQFTGIGVSIRPDLARDGLLVVTPIKDSPAYKAGLREGDLIVGIRREFDSTGKKLDPPEVFTTKGMKVSEAVKLITGKPGTKVKITVEREGQKPKEYELTRALVDTESVYGYKRKVNDSWDYFIDPASKIAYIHLTQFARNSLVEMDKAIKQLEKDGVKGLILDLRFNPGGYLNVAYDMCDLFVDDGLLVTVRPRVEEEEPHFGKFKSTHLQFDRETGRRKEYEFGSHTDFPMVCLVNSGSASASEILSACLQDHNRAVIMGERSYGKGSVQTMEKYKPTGGEIKMTIATFWRPSNKNLNKLSTKGRDEDEWGVTPDKDFIIKLTRNEEEQLFDKLHNWGNIPNREAKPKEPPKDFRDRQLDAALDYLRGQIKVSSNTPSKKPTP
jgi:C-terminal peptidase prc